MTIEAYMNKYHQSKKTVNLWISNGYIPGANLEADYIPDSARMPYTAARAKTANGIYKSIINASKSLKHVVPELYKIHKDEFDGYIRRLSQSGYIERIFNYKYPYEYIDRFEEMINRKSGIEKFYNEHPIK